MSGNGTRPIWRARPGRAESLVVRRSSFAVVAALAASAALAAAGCGGGDESAEGTPPDEYAAQVCGAISAWQKDLQTKVGTMTSKLRATSTPAAVKTEIVAFMAGATESTDQMVTKVEQAGPPAVEDGEALQRDLEAGLEKAHTAFAQARDRAKKLPTDDQAEFQREASALGTTLSEQGSAISETLSGLSTKYDSDELNTAFEEDAACKNL